MEVAVEALEVPGHNLKELAAAEEELARGLAREYSLEYVDVRHFRVQNDLFRRIPFDLMLRYGFIPESQLEGRLAVTPPTSRSSTSSRCFSANRWR